MKVVVTGGAGFIGSHLTDYLVKEGYEVHILDDFRSGYYEHDHPKVIVHKVDIRSNRAREIIEIEKPQFVFHLAAQADVTLSIKNPCEDADININGTINILEGCRKANVEKIIFSSTSAVYGNLQKSVITEQDHTAPISYYGLSKLSAETYIQLYQTLYGMNYTILRYGNVYGPRQTAKGEGGVIAVFMDKIKAGTSLNIHGDGKQTRDFVFVEDVVKANLAAMKSGNNDIFHVSTNKPTSIKELASILLELHPEALDIIHTTSRTGDIKHSCLKNEKCANELDWNPAYNIVQGLEKTYHYYLQNKLPSN